MESVSDSTQNPPGLPAISNRIGRFADFRHRLLQRMTEPKLLEHWDKKLKNPFGTWHQGTPDDYQTALIDLWAYLADILAFYQERIANEAYLPTATQRESLVKLTELIDFHPGPGTAARTLLAFTVTQNQEITLPSTLASGSMPKPGQRTAVFETEAPTRGLGDHSTLRVPTRAPANQFAPIRERAILSGSVIVPHRLAGAVPSRITAAAAEVYRGAGEAFSQTFVIQHHVALGSDTSSIEIQGTGSSLQQNNLAVYLDGDGSLQTAGRLLQVTSVTKNPALSTTTIQHSAPSEVPRSVVLSGLNTRLKSGDYVLVIRDEGKKAEDRIVHQLTKLKRDPASGTTTITWNEPEDVDYGVSVALYELTVRANPFGSNAPAWRTLPAALTGEIGQDVHGVLYGPYADTNWDAPSHPDNTKNNWSTLHMPQGPSTEIYLNGVYDTIQASPDSPVWAVLMVKTDDSRRANGLQQLDTSDYQCKVFRVNDAQTTGATGYAMSARSTRLTLDTHDEPEESGIFPLRDTVILVGSKQLQVEPSLPLPDAMAGDVLVLQGECSNLHAGQTLVVQEQPLGKDQTTRGEAVEAEHVVLAGPPIVDPQNSITMLPLTAPLRRPYLRARTTVLANVVEATQGETVPDEVLGSGDGTAFQSFRLKRKPLTYVRSSDPHDRKGIRSTLVVSVNGVQWHEERTLHDSLPNAHVYSTRQDDDGYTIVQFGDGVQGARPPSGTDNIHATYRIGLGAAGNLAPGGVGQLRTGVPGLQSVVNPIPAYGGVDPDSAEDIRVKAPAFARTLGHAVSLPDYADLALSYTGVAHARADWVGSGVGDPEAHIRLTVVTSDGTLLSNDPTFAQGLQRFIDARRDASIPLQLADFVPVYVDLSLVIDVREDYPRNDTLLAVQAALSSGRTPTGQWGFFAISRQRLGEPIYVSAIYSAAQAVDGVRDARIVMLARRDRRHEEAPIPHDIALKGGELAIIENDPGRPDRGTVTVTLGRGGFEDV